MEKGGGGCQPDNADEVANTVVSGGNTSTRPSFSLGVSLLPTLSQLVRKRGRRMLARGGVG